MSGEDDPRAVAPARGGDGPAATSTQVESNQSSDSVTLDEALRAVTPRVWVTPAIYVVNAAVFGAMVATGISPKSPTTDDLLKWGASYGPWIVLDGQWWRTITHAFVHAGWEHMLLNMGALWEVGALAERVYGSPAYLAVYLLAGVAASLAQVAWMPRVPSAGASGAVFGVYGCVLAFALVRRHHLRTAEIASLRRGTVAFIGLNLIGGLLTPNVGNAAHVGGLVAGFLAGALLARDLRAPSVSGSRLLLRGGALVLVLVVAALGVRYRVLAEQMVDPATVVDAGGDSTTVSSLMQACEGGSVDSCARLGERYSIGEGVARDDARAAALFKQACDGGVMMGCADLGWAYAQGEGVAKDDARAAALFKQACDADSAMGCLLLGAAYGSGRGVPSDRVRAVGLYKRACDGGELQGCAELGRAHMSGFGVAKDEARAAALLKQACDGGNMDGCANLGMAYSQGKGVIRDEVQAASLFKRACSGKVQSACDHLVGR